MNDYYTSQNDYQDYYGEPQNDTIVERAETLENSISEIMDKFNDNYYPTRRATIKTIRYVKK